MIKVSDMFMKHMTKLFDWIGSWYNEMWAWIFCLGSLAIAIVWLSIV